MLTVQSPPAHSPSYGDPPIGSGMSGTSWLTVQPPEPDPTTGSRHRRAFVTVPEPTVADEVTQTVIGSAGQVNGPLIASASREPLPVTDMTSVPPEEKLFTSHSMEV